MTNDKESRTAPLSFQNLVEVKEKRIRSVAIELARAE
eukprot:CAMPEP_0184870122 /NCGR_PEP_ID=MMETSP0580-20130426/36552_1 /TAXON_ID=1118495 /ORGANISM="Dactyliosolen fragilissimus" /LENGTH=36 /DNA_ID= /DNA_START= /DNA_END= /DNA_ORIENTATION=